MSSLLLPQKFYARETTQVARDLLGQRLVRVWRGKRLSGLIVETEAYLGPGDAAAHTWKGRNTERVKSMYLEGGHAYVYMIYGMYFCLNVVTKKAGEPEAVLIRAVEPECEFSHRTDGPGRLCKAMRIDRKLDGEHLRGPTIFIEQGGHFPAKEEIGSGPRIGVDYAGEAALWPLRFFWKGNAHLSRREKRARKDGL
ncbi:MAG TPA: DNA-3-methyladenine glycosylase [Bdellovibrionota bacterium]|jgi:DNA-3-methyladenine glycosylase